jgi:hypothetical protein
VFLGQFEGYLVLFRPFFDRKQSVERAKYIETSKMRIHTNTGTIGVYRNSSKVEPV